MGQAGHDSFDDLLVFLDAVAVLAQALTQTRCMMFCQFSAVLLQDRFGIAQRCQNLIKGRATLREHGVLQSE
jgi:hypothetical protein